jgi:hypothetical protein
MLCSLEKSVAYTTKGKGTKNEDFIIIRQFACFTKQSNKKHIPTMIEHCVRKGGSTSVSGGGFGAFLFSAFNQRHQKKKFPRNLNMLASAVRNPQVREKNQVEHSAVFSHSCFALPFPAAP